MKRRKKCRINIRRKFLLAVIVLLGILFVGGTSLIGAWVVMDWQGRNRLEKKQEALPQNMAGDFTASGDIENLQTGELRYEGKHTHTKMTLSHFCLWGLTEPEKRRHPKIFLKEDRPTLCFLQCWTRKKRRSA